MEAAQSSSSSSSEVQDIESNVPSDVCTASECGGDDNCEQVEELDRTLSEGKNCGYIIWS